MAPCCPAAGSGNPPKCRRSYRTPNKCRRGYYRSRQFRRIPVRPGFCAGSYDISDPIIPASLRSGPQSRARPASFPRREKVHCRDQRYQKQTYMSWFNGSKHPKPGGRKGNISPSMQGWVCGRDRQYHSLKANWSVAGRGLCGLCTAIFRSRFMLCDHFQIFLRKK